MLSATDENHEPIMRPNSPKVKVRLQPSVERAATHTVASKARSSEYSTRVAPSSLRNIDLRPCLTILLTGRPPSRVQHASWSLGLLQENRLAYVRKTTTKLSRSIVDMNMAVV